MVGGLHCYINSVCIVWVGRADIQLPAATRAANERKNEYIVKGTKERIKSRGR